jgi:4-hydroxybenzoate polyprenyltransferase
VNRARVTDRLREYALLMRLDRPIGIFLLLWPTLWAIWMASNGLPSAKVTSVFVLGVVLMRSAGCVINDYADRDFDPFVARTRSRPVAARRVSPQEALALFVSLGLGALALVLLMNDLTVMLALAGMVLAATYPFMKRFTFLPQVHLGVAFAWSVPMAYAAQTGVVPPVAWLLGVGVVAWTVAYDTMYAMVDREDDLRIGLKSTAILFGDVDRLFIGILQVMTITALLLVGLQLRLGVWYYAGVAVAGALSVYQQYLIREREPQACLRAFLNNNWVGAAVFAGLFLHYLTGG